MLSLALKARLPLITVTAPDNGMVLETLAAVAAPLKMDVKLLAGSGTSFKMASNTLFYTVGTQDDQGSLLKDIRTSDRNVLVMVNPGVPQSCAYHAGMLLPTEQQIRKFVSGSVPATQINQVMPVFHDMSLFQIETLLRMCAAQYGVLTAKALLKMRVNLFGHAGGLVQLPAEDAFYMPDARLKKWVQVNRKIIHMKDIHPDLVPRGLLFDGPPGTGKTAGAKHIARELDLPLLKLEPGTFLGKYVGESEGNMLKLLQVLDREAPCVFLIDEVEKLFSMGTDDAGVTNRLMGQLLWWLQEHDSRVLTIMTTNNRNAVPPELFREGRIDEVFDFTYLDTQAVKMLSFGYLKMLGYEKLGPTAVATLKSLPNPTPAKVMAALREMIKANLTTKESQS